MKFRVIVPVYNVADYLPACVRDMAAIGETYGARWLCAGKCSNKGHPHHPLYLRRDEPVRDFDVKAYLDLIGG